MNVTWLGRNLSSDWFQQKCCTSWLNLKGTSTFSLEDLVSFAVKPLFFPSLFTQSLFHYFTWASLTDCYSNNTNLKPRGSRLSLVFSLTVAVSLREQHEREYKASGDAQLIFTKRGFNSQLHWGSAIIHFDFLSSHNGIMLRYWKKQWRCLC